MQKMYAVLDGVTTRLQLPSAASDVMPGIPWGSFDEFLTPAYWKGQAWQHEHLGTYRDLRLGRSLPEELAACLLGGYGMPAELGLAAFRRLRVRGLLDGVPSSAEIERALSEPFPTPLGVMRRYRFPHQKARYLSASLKAIRRIAPPTSDVVLRDLLTKLPGVGPKTASWAVRNHRSSDSVAIIDVHILRAGHHLGLFSASWQPQRHYRRLESAFLAFAAALDVRPSVLDSLIWDYMRRLGPIVANRRRPATTITATPRNGGRSLPRPRPRPLSTAQ